MISPTSPLNEELLSNKTGDLDPIDGLQWSGVNLNIPSEKKMILNSCYGQVRKGELLGIVGSSGSGKTSLLNLLAFRLEKNCETSGKIVFNDQVLTSREQISKVASFVSQADTFHPNLTPRGTIQ